MSISKLNMGKEEEVPSPQKNFLTVQHQLITQLPSEDLSFPAVPDPPIPSAWAAHARFLTVGSSLI